MDYQTASIALHRKTRGKLSIESKVPLNDRDDLSLAYTPGVAGPCLAIAEDRLLARELTATKFMIAVISDGSAVLGLGDIGPEAALPVMEGKCVLFKRFGGLDAFPIVLGTQNVEEIIAAVKAIAPTFGGINLEDISAPRCFEIEERLKAELDIPVMHDDQHGTAVVVLAGLINALKVADKKKEDVRVVVNGAGAAGIAITKLLARYGFLHLVMCDSTGVIHRGRTDLNTEKIKILEITNQENKTGTLKEVLVGADIFLGISKGNLLTSADVRTMNTGAIVFAMANPTPEISLEEARAGGALIVATGRSDAPNQVNNSLAFPGIFRGAIDARVRAITDDMKLSAAVALAATVSVPTAEKIIPGPFDPGILEAVSGAITGLKRE